MTPTIARHVSQITSISVFFPSSSASLGIDSLDNRIRDELLKSSHTFFMWVLISAFVVVIGVLLEGPELLQELWPKLFRWFTWNSQERLHKFERNLKKVGLVGWLLVGIGVAGEGVFEVLQSRAEGQLQTFNDILLTDARLTATTAKNSAGDAANAADLAQIKADGADNLARTTRLEADSFDERIVSANKTATEAESHLAAALERTARLEAQLSWRTVTPEQSATIAAYLKPSFYNPNMNFRGLKISLEYNQGDLEASEYAEDLGKALRVALNGFGVEIGEPQGKIVMGFTGPPITGLILHVNRANDGRAVVLQRALGAAGIVAVEEPESKPEGTFSLFVGVRPRPSAAKQ